MNERRDGSGRGSGGARAVGSEPPKREAERPSDGSRADETENIRNTRPFTSREWEEVLAKLTPLPREKRPVGDGVYSGGGSVERLGLPPDFKPPTLPVGRRDPLFERRKKGTRETGFLVGSDGTIDRAALAGGKPGDVAGARLDGLVALVFPNGCNVWTNFDYRQRRRSNEGSISLLIQQDEVTLLGGARATPVRRQTEYLGGQILFSFARADERPLLEVLTSMGSMLERSATFAAELVRYTTADFKPRLQASAIVSAMDVDGSRAARTTRELCCVFAYTLKDNHVFAAAKARKIVLKFIMSGEHLERSSARTPTPTPLRISRLIAPEAFGCLAYVETDLVRTIARLSVFPDVSSFRQIELNGDLIDAQGRPCAERLFGPQGEEVSVSTPGIERYL